MGNGLFAAAFACAALWMTAADAQLGRPMNGRPVTANDLVGKKICWSHGRILMYGANGQFADERGHHTTWVVTEPGVVKVGKNRYTQYEILPDGSFYAHEFCARCGSITGHFEVWGRVCN